MRDGQVRRPPDRPHSLTYTHTLIHTHKHPHTHTHTHTYTRSHTLKPTHTHTKHVQVTSPSDRHVEITTGTAEVGCLDVWKGA